MRVKKLSKEVKKLVWAPITSNLGLGWYTGWNSRSGGQYERQGRVEPNIGLDDPTKVKP